MNPQPNLTPNKPGKRGLARIFAALGYSRDGLAAAWQYEAAFRQLVWLHAALLVVQFFCDFDTPVRMLLLGVSFLSLITEVLNSAIEATIDYISSERHPLAKRAKDLGSAAQLLALVMTALLWLMALYG